MQRAYLRNLAISQQRAPVNPRLSRFHSSVILIHSLVPRSLQSWSSFWLAWLPRDQIEITDAAWVILDQK